MSYAIMTDNRQPKLKQLRQAYNAITGTLLQHLKRYHPDANGVTDENIRMTRIINAALEQAEELYQQQKQEIEDE